MSVLALYSFHSVKGGVGKSTLATLIAEGLRSNAPETVAPRTKALRTKFQNLHFINP